METPEFLQRRACLRFWELSAEETPTSKLTEFVARQSVPGTCLLWSGVKGEASRTEMTERTNNWDCAWAKFK
eukprot:6484501-Amphidinium_carterae.1